MRDCRIPLSGVASLIANVRAECDCGGSTPTIQRRRIRSNVMPLCRLVIAEIYSMPSSYLHRRECTAQLIESLRSAYILSLFKALP